MINKTIKRFLFHDNPMDDIEGYYKNKYDAEYVLVTFGIESIRDGRVGVNTEIIIFNPKEGQ